MARQRQRKTKILTVIAGIVLIYCMSYVIVRVLSTSNRSKIVPGAAIKPTIYLGMTKADWNRLYSPGVAGSGPKWEAKVRRTTTRCQVIYTVFYPLIYLDETICKVQVRPGIWKLPE